MSHHNYQEPAVPVCPGDVSFAYRDTRTKEVSHLFSLWELYQLKDHHLPDYRAPVSPTPRPGQFEWLRLHGEDGCALKLERPNNMTPCPTDCKGRLGKVIGTEYFHHYIVTLRWDPRRVELLPRNAFLIKTWHRDNSGWNVEVDFKKVDYSVLDRPLW